MQATVLGQLYEALLALDDALHGALRQLDSALSRSSPRRERSALPLKELRSLHEQVQRAVAARHDDEPTQRVSIRDLVSEADNPDLEDDDESPPPEVSVPPSGSFRPR